MECKLVRGGFSFCGVDIADLGLSYAPEKEDTYVYRPSDINIHEQTFDGHHGGYFFGTSKQPKEFILRCYFENSAIDKGIMEHIYYLFKPGKSGKLVFDRRPWCYYYATVTEAPHPELSSYLNGVITISMKAYYPYARGDASYYDPIGDRNRGTGAKVLEDDVVLKSTALLESLDMTMATNKSITNLTTAKKISNNTHLLLHNPGTEYAPLSIFISGNVGLGVTIRNVTTNQECKIVALNKEVTTDLGKQLYIDGINGNVNLISDNSHEPAFLYHDSGFISLAPAYPAIRNVYIQNVNSTTIKLTNRIYDDVVGHYIFLNGEWNKITAINGNNTITVQKAVSTLPTGRTMITRMNEIEIIPISNMNIDHIAFDYRPTYA